MGMPKTETPACRSRQQDQGSQKKEQVKKGGVVLEVVASR